MAECDDVGGFPTEGKAMKRGEGRRAQGSDLDDVRSVLRLLGSDLRCRMIVELAEQPMDAGTIARRLGCSPSTARRNLGRLADGGIVEVAQVGRRRTYDLGKITSVRKQRSAVVLQVDLPCGNNVAMKLNWPRDKN